MQGDLVVRDVILKPGEYYFSKTAEPVRIHTLLGSCISITLWHPKKRIGGMCHYLLSSSSSGSKLSRGHYAEDILEIFSRAVTSVGTRPREYEVKMFGGGNMFAASARPDAAISVPRDNVDTGRRLLSKHGFDLKSADVGGAFYRRIYFDLWNGDVHVLRGKVYEEASQ